MTREQEVINGVLKRNMTKKEIRITTNNVWKATSLVYRRAFDIGKEEGYKQGQLSEREKDIKKIKKFEFNYYDCEIGTGFDDWVKREKERIIEQIQGENK